MGRSTPRGIPSSTTGGGLTCSTILRGLSIAPSKDPVPPVSQTTEMETMKISLPVLGPPSPTVGIPEWTICRPRTPSEVIGRHGERVLLPPVSVVRSLQVRRSVRDALVSSTS